MKILRPKGLTAEFDLKSRAIATLRVDSRLGTLVAKTEAHSK
jgi:hypothetical protein